MEETSSPSQKKEFLTKTEQNWKNSEKYNKSANRAYQPKKF